MVHRHSYNLAGDCACGAERPPKCENCGKTVKVKYTPMGWGKYLCKGCGHSAYYSD